MSTKLKKLIPLSYVLMFKKVIGDIHIIQRLETLLSMYLYIYFSNKFILSNNIPVPSATHVKGLSATKTGTFNS